MGIDCSWLVQLVYRAIGINLPYKSKILRVVKEIDFNDAQKGDVIGFTNKDGKINHAGIIIDEGKTLLVV
jgi:cell wall-associated NlpC family hydrolase